MTSVVVCGKGGDVISVMKRKRKEREVGKKKKKKEQEKKKKRPENLLKCSKS
jgi:hypothetical protein